MRISNDQDFDLKKDYKYYFSDYNCEIIIKKFNKF